MGLIVEVKNLTKFYGKLRVLDNLSFAVKKSELVSIIGPSGCGKTTLLKILGGLTQKTQGEITVKARSVKSALKQREFGFVFQNPTLLPWRSSLKNVALPLEILGLKRPPRSPQRLLKIVGLEDFENSYPKTLSGGMQQRVAIARALVFKPSILLMDEPFGALDEINRNKMDLELLRIWQEEKNSMPTIIFVTHSIPEAVFLSDRVIVLSARPAKIEKMIKINLPRPRKTEMKVSSKYHKALECIRKVLNAD